MTEDSIRTRLLERIRRLPAQQLTAVDQFLLRLESTPQPQLNCLSEKQWPHAPLHSLSEHGTYLVTAGTLHKQHHFLTAERLELLEERLLTLAQQYGWQLEAWAVFPNHYHFIGHSQVGSGPLNVFLSLLHTDTANQINKFDNASGRRVWHNYWETQLTFEKSYFARLNYVHQNAVKHGLVPVANQYRWCSAGWFERTARPAQVKTISSFKTDRLRVLDDFDVPAAGA